MRGTWSSHQTQTLHACTHSPIPSHHQECTHKTQHHRHQHCNFTFVKHAHHCTISRIFMIEGGYVPGRTRSEWSDQRLLFVSYRNPQEIQLMAIFHNQISAAMHSQKQGICCCALPEAGYQITSQELLWTALLYFVNNSHFVFIHSSCSPITKPTKILECICI